MSQQNNKIKTIIKNQKGFTLMEILVVIFILSFVLTGIFTVLNWTYKTGYTGVDTQIEQENFRIFNSHLINDLQFAKDIQITNTPGKDTLSYTALNGDVTVAYFQSDGLYKKVGTSTIKIATGQVYETGYPAVYFEPDGMIHFNFYASNINSLMYLSVKPIVFDKN
jgi:prepilin-type N-terminal cleavage/methylation domain-containing protein